MTTENDYHKQRQMFFVINGEIIVAEKGSEKSHREWLMAHGRTREEAESLIETQVRGALNPDGQILFFRGRNWGISPEIEKIFFENLPELARKMELKPGTPIGGGAVQQEVGQPWQPRVRYGTVGDYIKN